MREEPYKPPSMAGTIRGHRALVEAIPDCGHFPWVEQPTAFRAAVERLLRA